MVDWNNLNLFASVPDLGKRAGRLIRLWRSRPDTLPRVTRSAPHVRHGLSVAGIHRHFVLASVPVLLIWIWNIGWLVTQSGSGQISAWLTGWRAAVLDLVAGFTTADGQILIMLTGLLLFLPVILTTLVTVMFWESLFAITRRRPVDQGWLMHGWLFAMLLPLPASLPQVIVGISFGVVFGKHIFGGAGKYLISPAALGILFLLISYPHIFSSDTAIWSRVAGGGVEAVISASLSWWQVFVGAQVSSIGASSALACLLGAGWLIWSGAASWRIISGALLGLILATLLVNALGSSDPAWQIPWPWHLVLGSFAFTAVFLATDPSSSALTRHGRWAQGALLGVLTILMRTLDPSHPESSLYAVLLAALFAPLVDYFVVHSYCRPASPADGSIAMSEERIGRTLAVAAIVAVFCSLVVSSTVVYLRPIHLAWAELDRNRNVLLVAGLLPAAEETTDRQVVTLFRELDVRLVDLASGQFDHQVDALAYDPQSAAADPTTSVEIPAALDLARMGRRARLAAVYLVWEGDRIQRIVLPLRGQGMWAPIEGFIALQADFNTVAGIGFHQHGETPGIGDRIQQPDWQASWLGKKIYGPDGQLRIGFAAIHPAGQSPEHRFDAISGATVTVTAVSQMVAYWLGDHGYGPFLDQLRNNRDKQE